jgi:hypothetical protein
VADKGVIKRLKEPRPQIAGDRLLALQGPQGTLLRQFLCTMTVTRQTERKPIQAIEMLKHRLTETCGAGRPSLINRDNYSALRHT